MFCYLLLAVFTGVCVPDTSHYCADISGINADFTLY